ncbi:Phosphoglycolate phosphatase [Candidatus Calditenuaceae archaeon HR02]|nr:Phosphoglycolate phosphatase [Candidatus Calditenuaceae archaeon HR02]
MGRGRFRLLALDMDGTLYSSHSYVGELEKMIVALVAEMLGVSAETAAKRLAEAKSRALTTSASLDLLKIPRSEFYERLSQMVEPARHIKPLLGVEDRLRRIKARGLKIALHTNAGRALTKKVLSALGLRPDIFDIIVTSEDAAPKPSPQGYELLLLSAGCRAKECIYVGDRAVAELRTAKIMGMFTVKVGGKASIWADLHVGDILEALRRIERLVEDPVSGGE